MFSGGSTNTTPPDASNMIRYGSAPSSLLMGAVESAMDMGSSSAGSGHRSGFSGESTQCKQVGAAESSDGQNEGSYGMRQNLNRHSSSPAGFFNHLSADLGFFMTKGIEGYKLSRLGSQLSFTKQDSLTQIDEIDPKNDQKRPPPCAFSISSWEDSNNDAFVFSPDKRAKLITDDVLNSFATIESQFGTAEEAMETYCMEKLSHIPQDSVPCKIRAKRGCATHPRSIAERERRTRISAKLKKLQDLVPNMDKQTSYADMLDLAVQHIKGLQTQIQKLNKELDSCTCGCKQNVHG